MLYTVLVCVLSAIAVVASAASFLMSSYTSWVYGVKIPATLARREIPPMPLRARLGDRVYRAVTR